MKTIVVVDDSVFCHQMHHLVENLTIPEEHYLGFIKAQLVYLHSLDWLPNKPEDFTTISVLDSKPYWRTEYLKRPEVVSKVPRRLAIHYKGGRKFPEYSFTKLKKAIHHITTTAGWNSLKVYGFEADDLAASIVKVADGNYKVLLLTVDTDWMGLINTSTSWYCMHGYYPQQRNLTNYNVWVEKRLGVTFDNPRELWDYKAVHGDKSDNLPKGSPIEVIDLLNPPTEYCLWNSSDYVTQVSTMLATKQPDQPTSTGAVNYLRKLGIPLAVKRVDITG